MAKKKNPLLLTLDKNYIPVTSDDGDEFFRNGYFEFNITKMQDYIDKNKDSVIFENIEVEKYRRPYKTINENHIDSVDITKPIILAEISPSHFNIIDGNHRIEKAHRMGVKEIPAYRLTVKQHLSFFKSTEKYCSYVSYWNGKIKTMEENEKSRFRLPQIFNLDKEGKARE